jgi:5-methylcytosine-specific restriction endonuclease McrA
MSSGHKHTEEHKEKIRQAMLGQRNHRWGKHLTDETKAKITAANKGKRFSPRTEFKPGPRPDLRNRVTKQCAMCTKPFEVKRSHAPKSFNCSGVCRNKYFSATRTGRKIHTEAFKQRLRDRNWRGGVTSTNMLFRRSPEYKTWRQHVFNRDRYTCQGCGKIGGQLHADHELPFSLFPNLRLEILNGRTLCVPCHRKTPTYAASLEKFKHLYI